MHPISESRWDTLSVADTGHRTEILVSNIGLMCLNPCLLVQNPFQLEQEEEYLGSSKQEEDKGEEEEDDKENIAKKRRWGRTSFILCKAL